MHFLYSEGPGDDPGEWRALYRTEKAIPGALPSD
jgi:hypothetical protein